jgi:hypothetical protein
MLLLITALACLAALAGTATAALLFNGTTLAKFTVEGEKGTITEVTDPLGSGKTVFKNVVTDKNLSPFGVPRAQQTSTSIIEKGKEFWLKTKIMVPSSFPKSIANGDSLVSIYGPPYGGPAPWALETYGENLSWQRNSTYGWDIPWEIPLEREKWISIVLHERFDEASKGFVEMWVNGEQVTFFAPGTSYNPNKHAETTKLEMATMDASNNEKANNVRLMQSRVKGDAETATVYFGSLKIGDTRDDVSDPTFNGKKISDYSENQSAPKAVTEVSDPLGSGETVIQMTVSDKDVEPITPTKNPRAQLVGPSILKKGNEFWLGTKFLIPESFPSVPGWMTLVAVYGPPFAGSGPWQLEVSNNELAWQRNETYGYDIPWTVPLEKGKWTRLLLHMRLDESGKGWVEMWINGKRLTFFKSGTSYNPSKIAETNHLAMSTMDASNKESANSPRISQYRELGMFESGTLYFGPMRVGEERADVDY